MGHIEYRVRSGDTLSVIARRHKVAEDVVARLNGISDVNPIRAGQLLRIPKARSSTALPPPQPKSYRVQAGDTLSQIAQRHGVPVAELAQANGISDPNRINIGQMLKIPAWSQPSARSQQSPGAQALPAASPPPASEVSQSGKAIAPASSPKGSLPGLGTSQRVLSGISRSGLYGTASARGGGAMPIMLASLSLTSLSLTRQPAGSRSSQAGPLSASGDNLLYGPFHVRVSSRVDSPELVVLTVWQVFGLKDRLEAEAFAARWGAYVKSFKPITEQELKQGYTVMYIEADFYREVMAAKSGSNPERARKEAEARRKKLGQLEKKALEAARKRVDEEFQKRTGGRKFSDSKTPEDRELWESIQDDVLREADAASQDAKVRFDALPKAVKELLLSGTERWKPEQYVQLARVGEKLQQLTASDLALYKQLPKTLTQDLDQFEQSVEAFVQFRAEYQAALEEAAWNGGSEETLEQKLTGTWVGVDIGRVRAQPEGYREAMARQLAWEQTKVRLEHMASHPGETAVDMVKGLNPGTVADAVIRDVKEAASGDKTQMARWAAGIGGVGKISGWVAGVAAITYVALLFVPGVNLVVVAQTAMIAGVTAVALSAVESELRVQAAADARSEDEFRYNVDKASEAQVAAITGVVLMVAGFALKMLGAIRLPGRLQNVSTALRMAQQALVKVLGIGPALETIRATLRKAILGERAGLPEALAEQILKLRKSMRTLEGLSGEEFLQRLARGDAALRELTGISPEQARQFLAIQKTPAGAGLGEKLRQDVLRALRDAPGEAQARVDRSLANMNEALAEIEAAKTAQDLAAAVQRAQARFDAKALADEAASQQQAVLRQRLQEELLKKPPPPREPAPATEPPQGMSDNLKAVRKSFDASTPEGRAAIEQFDFKFERMGRNSSRMEKMIEGLKVSEQQTGKTVQQSFTEGWSKDNPTARAPYGESIGEVPELRVRIEVLQNEIAEFAKSRSHVTGVKEWQGKLADWAMQLDQMIAGKIEATASDVIGTRANIDGVQAEFRSSLREAGVIATGRKVPPRLGEKPLLDVDIVADNGKTWIDVKRVEPFGVESSNWKGKPGMGGGMAKKGLRAMAVDLCEAAKNNLVDGKPPKIVYDFPMGVGESVAKALRALGRERGVQLEVRGPVLPDSKVVPIPGRFGDDYDEAIER